jgi:hypothetical protein
MKSIKIFLNKQRILRGIGGEVIDLLITNNFKRPIIMINPAPFRFARLAFAYDDEWSGTGEE